VQGHWLDSIDGDGTEYTLSGPMPARPGPA